MMLILSSGTKSIKTSIFPRMEFSFPLLPLLRISPTKNDISTAVFLYLNWKLFKRLLFSRNSITCEWTAFSITFDNIGNSEIGLQFSTFDVSADWQTGTILPVFQVVRIVFVRVNDLRCSVRVVISSVQSLNNLAGSYLELENFVCSFGNIWWSLPFIYNVLV